MTWAQFAIVLSSCMITMLICRVAPLFILKGRDLSETTKVILGYIPPAAFAALVANDLLSPTMFSAGILEGMLPLIAALGVVILARTTKSLAICALGGVLFYALLSLL